MEFCMAFNKTTPAIKINGQTIIHVHSPNQILEFKLLIEKQQAGLLAHGSSYSFRPSHMANYHAVALIKTFVPTYSGGTAVELHDFPFFISKFGYGKPTENLMIIDYHISKICIQGKTCNLIRDYHSKLS